MALSAKHLKDLHLPDKAIDVLDEAGAAQKLLPAEQRVGDDRRRRRSSRSSRRWRACRCRRCRATTSVALPTLDAELKRVIFGQDAAIDEVASAIKLSRSGLRVARQADRQLPVRRADRRRQDRAGAPARAHPRRRVHPLRHVRVHGEARGVAADRRAAGLRRLRGGRPADRRDPQVAARGAAARRDREGASGHVQHPAAGDGSRHADRLARPQGRLPPRHPDHDDQRRRARSVGPAAWASARRGKGGSSRGALERMFTPEFRNRLDAIVNFNALGTAEIERVVDKQIDELRAMVAPKGVTIELDAGGARVAGGEGLRSRVRRAADGAPDRARRQEAAVGGAAVRVAGRRRRGADRRSRATRFG